MIRETEQDKEHEQAIKQVVEASGKVRLIKTKNFSRIDFVMVRPDGKAIGLCECKTRSHAKGDYDTLMIDFDKVEAGLHLCKHFRNPETKKSLDWYLLVQFTDGVYYYRYNSEHELTIREGGRTDRGDAKDIEAVVHVPITYFKGFKQ